MVMSCDCGPLTRGLGILKLRNKRVAFKSVIGWKVQQVDKRRVDVEELSRLPANLPALDSGSCEDQRNSGPIVPQGILACNFLFSNMIPVVRPEDDDGVFFQTACPEGLEKSLYLSVYKGGARQVGTGEIVPLVSILEKLKSRLW
tara:strand:- start:342 stop:776 length:435 start_codon:yes stop_codon:yes gene_type:complete